MKLILSSYLSPWKSVDHSLDFNVSILGRLKEITIEEPAIWHALEQIEKFADYLKSLTDKSETFCLDFSGMSPCDDTPITYVFELTISPDESGKFAYVRLRTKEGNGPMFSEETHQETVSITKLN